MPRRSTVEILDHEWGRVAHSRQGARVLAVWRLREATLAQYLTLAALVRHGHDPGTSNALARLAPNDPIAARALLQLVIPVLTRSATTPGDGDVDDLVALAWEAIRTRRQTHSGSAVEAICAEIRRRRRQLRAVDRPRSVPLIDADQQLSAPRPASTPVPFEAARAAVALHDAFRDRAISTDDFRLIARTRLLGDSIESFADEEGVTAATLSRRRRRAEQLLRRRMTGTCHRSERAA